MKQVHLFSEWIYRLTALNLLWILFTVAGLGIFGAAPATAAAFRVVYSWQHEEQIDVSMFRLFLNTFKQRFVSANILFLLILAGGAFLYSNLYLAFRIDHPAAFISIGIAIFLTVLYATIVVYSLPLIVHSNIGIFRSMKLALIYGISFPFDTISLFLSGFILFWLAGLTPVIHLFFTASILTYVIMAIITKNNKKITVSG
ncbi:YesL family protein [Salisediminibacterium halotolerans]|uniref:YesL family protein n=1 Tax=Salisediminibacterium halotolerans TaxID=517425 RepID=UPI000EB1F181|nr:DUF624 domain-containing protein [Salisediminibacterium halotolerans]RLJ78295.1 putative membrane protein YesL [Actinophytocola xinjiangensis]RPE88366.1 putative membrane protein YesL [Salisediminibacterium halotolerans]TWG37271.1 putative membrane protein YesL [Salisediminibacterium halotolerans]GEL08322.1 hypothetical protein SHA02_17380 [Salisediminibacterium halotolerans]